MFLPQGSRNSRSLLLMFIAYVITQYESKTKQSQQILASDFKWDLRFGSMTGGNFDFAIYNLLFLNETIISLVKVITILKITTQFYIQLNNNMIQ